jgi:hypothetical protein
MGCETKSIVKQFRSKKIVGPNWDVTTTTHNLMSRINSYIHESGCCGDNPAGPHDEPIG